MHLESCRPIWRKISTGEGFLEVALRISYERLRKFYEPFSENWQILFDETFPVGGGPRPLAAGKVSRKFDSQFLGDRGSNF